MTPSCSPVDPRMTRTSRARIRPFTRICGCRFELAPNRRSRSAPHRRISISRNSRRPPSVNAWALYPRHGCDRPQRGAHINNREQKGSCRQQFRAGKTNLVTITCRSSNVHFDGGSPKCALCAVYAVASSSIESSVAARGPSFTTPENTARSPISVSITNAGRWVICSA